MSISNNLKVDILDYISLSNLDYLPSTIQKAFDKIKSYYYNSEELETIWQLKVRLNNEKNFIKFLKSIIN